MADLDLLLEVKMGSSVCPARCEGLVTSCLRPMLLMFSRRLLSLGSSSWKLRSLRKR